VGTTPDANWTRYVALLRSMDDAQLAQLTALGKAFADAGLVAGQARAYDYPSVSALSDILGLNVNIGEDGEVKLSKQNIDREKRKGGGFTYGPYLGPTAGEQAGPFMEGTGQPRGGGAGGAGGRGGGVAGAPRKVYTPLGGPGSKPRQGGGGRRPRAAAPTAEGLPLDDPSAALIGEWLDFSGKLKAEKPDLWVELWDFLHLAGQFEQVGYLRQHPRLIQFIQAQGSEQFGRLMSAFYVWQEYVMQAEGRTPGRDDNYRGERVYPQVLRVYQQRPSRTGLT